MSVNFEFVTTGAEPSAIGTPSFDGAGVDDFSVQGTYTGDTDDTFTVEIDAEGTPAEGETPEVPDTFAWSRAGDAEAGAEGVSITGDWQELEDGIQVKFLATVGHTLEDSWGIAAARARTYEEGQVIGQAIRRQRITAAQRDAVLAEIAGIRAYCEGAWGPEPNNWPGPWSHKIDFLEKSLDRVVIEG